MRNPHQPSEEGEGKVVEGNTTFDQLVKKKEVNGRTTAVNGEQPEVAEGRTSRI